MKKSETHFALCLSNEGYPASLEVGKLYRIVEDKEAAIEGLLRVVDESGEDYAFAITRFHLIALPNSVGKVLRTNSTSLHLAV